VLTTTFNPGGVISSLKAMVTAMIELGASCRACAMSSGGPGQGTLESFGVPTEVLGVPKHTLSFRTTHAVAELFRREAPMVVHAHCYEANFHACRARLRVPVPWLFITHHDPRLRVHRILMNRWLQNVPDRVVMVSEGLARLYCKWGAYRPERIFVLPNAVDTDRFRPQPKDEELARELCFSGCGPLIGNVGGFGRPKGQAVLVRAFAALSKTLPCARLMLVGDGKYRPAVQLLAQRLGVAERVSFTGSREDVPRLLSLIDVYVQPSWQEADPVALKEAMAAGKAVVSTATLGPSGFIRHGDNGLLVPIGNWRLMAQAIRQIVENQELAQRLGQSARRYAEEHFSIPVYRRRLAELYQPVVEAMGR
jgi:glycosyltransferase involved in cell wall biosynthesis